MPCFKPQSLRLPMMVNANPTVASGNQSLKVIMVLSCVIEVSEPSIDLTV
jgi:hypothetical protein